MKKCKICNKEFEENIENFRVTKRKADGSPVFRTECRECSKILDKKYKEQTTSTSKRIIFTKEK